METNTGDVDMLTRDDCIKCTTLAEAREVAELYWGEFKNSLVWEVDGVYYINDGIDPDTGVWWKNIPKNAYFAEN